MHDAAYTSDYFSAAYQHYMLTTDWERHLHNRQRVVATEIVWNTAQGPTKSLSRLWVVETTTIVNFLETIGVLQGCTTTHRCHITLNGHYCTGRWLQFTHGTYVLVDAHPQERPDDTESECEDAAPIAQAHHDDTSSTTSSSSQAEVDQLHLEGSFVTDTLIVYRPPGRTLRPLHLIEPVRTTDPHNLVVIMQHWQDLRYYTWGLVGVHPTYDQEYPQSDDAHIFVLVALHDLPGPLHQVVLTVLHSPNIFVQKAQITTPVITRDIILLLNRMDHFCQRTLTTCRVYLNSQLLPDGTTRRVANGDYVRISMTEDPTPEAAAVIAEEFQVPEGAPGWEYAGEALLGLMTREGSDTATMIQGRPRPSQAPQGHGVRDDELYWIGMGFFLTISLIVCSRWFDPPAKRTMTQCRRRPKDQHKNAWKTAAFMYLCLTPHLSSAWAMQFRHIEQDPGKIRVDPQYEFTDQLRPPGNPRPPKMIGTESIISTGNLTDYGCALLDFVTIYINIQQAQTGTGRNTSRASSTIETQPSLRATVQSTWTDGDKAINHHGCSSQSDEYAPRTTPSVCLPIASQTLVDTHLGNERVAPDKHPGFSIDVKIDVMNDEYGLTSSWALPPMPNPLHLPVELHPATQNVLSKSREDIVQVPPHRLYIFTDGSAGKHEEFYSSSWSFAVFGERRTAIQNIYR